MVFGIRGPKTILSSTIASALAEFFEVDPKTIESNLLSDAKIVLHSVRLREQTNTLHQDAKGRMVVVKVTGVVDEVAFTWAWAVSSKKKDATDITTSGTAGDGWVKNATLTIKGLKFQAELSYSDDETDMGPSLTQEESKKDPEKETSSSTNGQDSAKSKSGVQAFIQKQVKLMIDSLTLNVTDMELRVKMPQIVSGNGLTSSFSFVTGGKAIQVLSFGRKQTGSTVAETESPKEYQNVSHESDEDTVLEQRLTVGSFYTNVIAKASADEAAVTCKLIEPFSYSAAATRLAGDRFTSGFGYGLEVVGQTVATAVEAKLNDSESGIVVHAGKAQTVALTQLSTLVLAPSQPESAAEDDAELQATEEEDHGKQTAPDPKHATQPLGSDAATLRTIEEKSQTAEGDINEAPTPKDQPEKATGSDAEVAQAAGEKEHDKQVTPDAKHATKPLGSDVAVPTASEETSVAPTPKVSASQESVGEGSNVNGVSDAGVDAAVSAAKPDDDSEDESDSDSTLQSNRSSFFKLPFSSVSLVLEDSTTVTFEVVLFSYRADGSLCTMDAQAFVATDSSDPATGLSVSISGIHATLQPSLVTELELVEAARIPGAFKLTKPLQNPTVKFEDNALSVQMGSVETMLLSKGQSSSSGENVAADSQNSSASSEAGSFAEIDDNADEQENKSSDKELKQEREHNSVIASEGGPGSTDNDKEIEEEQPQPKKRHWFWEKQKERIENEADESASGAKSKTDSEQRPNTIGDGQNSSKSGEEHNEKQAQTKKSPCKSKDTADISGEEDAFNNSSDALSSEAPPKDNVDTDPKGVMSLGSDGTVKEKEHLKKSPWFWHKQKEPTGSSEVGKAVESSPPTETEERGPDSKISSDSKGDVSSRNTKQPPKNSPWFWAKQTEPVGDAPEKEDPVEKNTAQVSESGADIKVVGKSDGLKSTMSDKERQDERQPKKSPWFGAKRNASVEISGKSKSSENSSNSSNSSSSHPDATGDPGSDGKVNSDSENDMYANTYDEEKGEERGEWIKCPWSWAKNLVPAGGSSFEKGSGRAGETKEDTHEPVAASGKDEEVAEGQEPQKKKPWWSRERKAPEEDHQQASLADFEYPEAVHSAKSADRELPHNQEEAQDEKSTKPALSVPFPITMSFQELIFSKPDGRHRPTQITNFSVSASPHPNGTFVGLSAGKFENELLELENTASSAVLDLVETELVHNFRFAAESGIVTAGYSTEDWAENFHPEEATEQVIKHEENKQQRGEKNSEAKKDPKETKKSSVIKLPRAEVAELRIKIMLKGGIFSTNHKYITIKAFVGNEKTTSRDVINYYARAILSRAPGFITNAQVLGLNVVDSAATSYAGWLSSATPVGPAGGVAGVAAVDAIRGAINVGKTKRNATADDEWKFGDLARGIIYSTQAATQAGAAERGKSDAGGNIADFAVGVTTGATHYVGKNKARLGGAGAAGVGFAVGTVFGGPLGGIAGGFLVNAVTSKAIEGVEGEFSKSKVPKSSHPKLAIQDSEAEPQSSKSESSQDSEEGKSDENSETED